MQAGRNDPCPCGSGKKYKKCCMKNNAVSIDTVINSEFTRFMADYFWQRFEGSAASFKERNTHNKLFRDTIFLVTPNSFHEEMFAIWYGYFGEPSIWHQAREAGINSRSLRRQTQDHLRGMETPIVLLGEITAESDEVLEVKSWETGKSIQLNVFDLPLMSRNPGSVIISMALPYKEGYAAGYIPFTLDFSFSNVKEEVNELFKQSDLEDHQHFLQNRFFDIIQLLMLEYEEEPESDVPVSRYIESLNWEKDVYRKAAEHTAAFMEQHREVDGDLMLVDILHDYLHEYNPVIKKPEIYAAGVIDSCRGYIPIVGEVWTQKKLAAHFGVSAASISKAAWEMDDIAFDYIRPMLSSSPGDTLTNQGNLNGLRTSFFPAFIEKEMWEITQTADKEHLSLKQVTADFNEGRRIFEPETAEQEAQVLLYEAFEQLEHGYIDNAMSMLGKVDTMPCEMEDHYTLKGLLADDASVRKKYFDKAVTIGRFSMMRLEKQGHIRKETEEGWYVLEARPYLRALLHAGMQAVHDSRFVDAVSFFEEVLAWNPNDNQGVRDMLVPCCIITNRKKRAAELLEEYKAVHSGTWTANQYMYAIRFGTKKDKEYWIEQLTQVNPYIAYPLINDTISAPELVPNVYYFGEESEAAVYWEQTIEVWEALFDRKLN